MFKRLLPIATLMLICASTTTNLLAQIPEIFRTPERTTTTLRSAMMCRGVAAAGSTRRQLGNNNKNTSDIRFLCVNDSLFLTSRGDANLTEDPNPATQAGIGYIFYDCPPTISGPTTTDIFTDPCWTRNINGDRISTRGDISGRDTFFNNGALQRVFNGGRPTKFYFAPATFYDFHSPNQSYFEDNTACVNVNTRDGLPTDTFSVVYLNAIRITNVNTNGLTGSFTVNGGFPEYDNTGTFSFTVALLSNPSVTGTITSVGTARNGSTVNFSVPQNGQYIITARDGKSCDGIRTVLFPSITLKFSREAVRSGDTACVRVTATNFTNVATMQTFFEYDTTLVQFIGLRNSTVAGLDDNSINRVPNRNQLLLSWNSANGVSKPDNTTLFELCFRAIGPNGTMSPVGVKDTIANEAEDPTGVRLGTSWMSGQIRIAQIVTVNVPCVTGSPGDTVCLPIRVKGFTNIGSVQLYFVFDPSVVTFLEPARNINLPPNLDVTSSPLQPRIITASWNLPTGSLSRTDSTSLFDLCFRITGAIGSISPFRIVDTLGFQSEVTDAQLRPVNLVRESCSIIVANTNFTIRVTGQNARCNGERGGFRIVPDGVGAPFAYTWASASNPGVNGNGSIANSLDTARVSNIAIGKYYVTVTNSAGTRTRIDSVTVTQPNPLFLNPPQFVNPSCFDSRDGSLTLVNWGGGTQPYSFRWSTSPTDTLTAITGLAAGAYGVTMTDANGCKDSIPRFTIGVNEIVVSNTNAIDATCTGVNTGSITIGSVTGGTPTAGNYSFRWSSGPTSSGTSASLTNLAAGSYTLTVSDGRLCQKVLNFTVGITRSLSATATVGNISCSGQQNGFINAVATSTGTESRPYTFTWTGSVGTPNNTASSTTVSRLLAGTYPLSIRDNSGCRFDTSFTIRQPDSISLAIIDLKNESCIGGPNNGSISLAASGGTPRTSGLPYSFRWNRNNNDTLPIIGSLTAGTYSVTVTDASNCTKTQNFTILAPVLPILDSITVRAATCSDKNDGSARINVRAGTGLRIDSIRWSNTGFLDSITAVLPGTYTVTVTSSNGCQRIDTVRIPSPAPLSINRTRSSKTDPVCPKDATGTIILVMQGGTAPYTYQWSGGPNTSNSVFASLSAGTYKFTVTDSRGCTPTEDSVTIIDPPSIIATYSDIERVSCYGKCNPGDAKATVTASGGTANTGTYTFTWSTGESCNAGNSCIATLLCGGYQTVTITDNICGIIDSVLIPGPDSFSFDQPIVNQPSCNGDRDGSIDVRIKGGNPPYAYFWNNNTTQSRLVNVPAGNYSAIITDSKLCSYTVNVSLSQPDSLQIDTLADGTNNITCFNLTDGQIKVKRSGGNGGPTTWAWSNGNATDSLGNLKAGNYTITATDVKNCSTSVSINLTQPDPIYFFMQPPTPPKCNGDLTTIRVDTAFGSTYRHNFTVSVDNGPQYPIGYFVPVFAGPHQLQIIEQVTGCLLDTTITVNEPPAIKLSFDPVPPANQITTYLVGLGDSLRLSPNIVSSLPIDSVVWTPRTYLTFRNDPLRPFVRPLDDQQYKVRVYDVNGCTAEVEVLVELDRNRNVFVPNIFSPNADDRNDFFGVYTGVGVKNINFMRIYDRWGELLFSKQNVAPGTDASIHGWDGRFNGREVAPGVYVYLIEVTFEDGQTLLYRGDITLTR